MAVQIEGDHKVAQQWLGWANQRLRDLRVQTERGGLNVATQRLHPAEGVEVVVSVAGGLGTVRIKASAAWPACAFTVTGVILHGLVIKAERVPKEDGTTVIAIRGLRRVDLAKYPLPSAYTVGNRETKIHVGAALLKARDMSLMDIMLPSILAQPLGSNPRCVIDAFPAEGAETVALVSVSGAYSVFDMQKTLAQEGTSFVTVSGQIALPSQVAQFSGALYRENSNTVSFGYLTYTAPGAGLRPGVAEKATVRLSNGQISGDMVPSGTADNTRIAWTFTQGAAETAQYSFFGAVSTTLFLRGGVSLDIQGFLVNNSPGQEVHYTYTVHAPPGLYANLFVSTSYSYDFTRAAQIGEGGYVGALAFAHIQFADIEPSLDLTGMLDRPPVAFSARGVHAKAEYPWPFYIAPGGGSIKIDVGFGSECFSDDDHWVFYSGDPPLRGDNPVACPSDETNPRNQFRPPRDFALGSRMLAIGGLSHVLTNISTSLLSFAPANVCLIYSPGIKASEDAFMVLAFPDVAGFTTAQTTFLTKVLANEDASVEAMALDSRYSIVVNQGFQDQVARYAVPGITVVIFPLEDVVFLR